MYLMINWQDFLQHYWQKHPMLLKQAVVNFINPVSPDELAKLVIEKALESQLIKKVNGKCQVVHNVFNGYKSLGRHNWSLKVQAINHWHRPAEEFMYLFRTFPDWYREDLTVSFSVPGGGLGLYAKTSDVFIIQGIGRSRWRIWNPLSSVVHYDQKNFFPSIINEELVSGDVLYIPKGFPHEAISSETALSYCINLWTDNSLRMIRNWTESLSDKNHRGIEYSPSPDLLMRDDPTEILPQDITAIQNIMNQFLLQQRDDLETWFGQQMSQSSYDLPMAPAAQVYQPSQVQSILQQDISLCRLMGLRMLHIGDRYFLNGESLASNYADAWNIMAHNTTINGYMLRKFIDDNDFMTQLTLLINKGYWYFQGISMKNFFDINV
ncbi:MULTISPECIES: JmjC domain-containing protein [Candidatus Williamhamiltonella]|uniref:Uncharacterized protein n=1 Tax=Candidatus Williamhamiltonella defendens TaxID=138072 RepID=A0A2D3TBZ5_9ENTR|nr:cupin domain-containing protein [Candidatus Hamiltonella defensa]ATW33051.1 hypothetical protein BJP43_00800 [Candidatus Hamiltonella defensa]AYB49140.1 hypothetical protein CJJ19_06125 [Candidatus Hamiltonella defensa]